MSEEIKSIVISFILGSIGGGIAAECLGYYLKKRKEKKDKSSVDKGNGKRMGDNRTGECLFFGIIDGIGTIMLIELILRL